MSQSCRSIFYYVIRSLLEEVEERTGEMRIRIGLPAIHFGSFYNLLKSMEKSMNCSIEYYQGCQMAIARFLDRMCFALRAFGLWLRYTTLQNFAIWQP